MSKLVVGSIEDTAYSGVRIPAYARTVEKSDWSKSVASPPSPAMRYRKMVLRLVLVQKFEGSIPCIATKAGEAAHGRLSPRS